MATVAKVLAALAIVSEQHSPETTYVDMEHDILYLPHFEKDDKIAKELEALGCHWDEEAGSWAMY